MENRKSLKDMAASLSNNLPFMEGREKGDFKTLIGSVVVIKDFGFMNDEEGDYVCFITEQDPKRFYFGGMVLTDDLHKLEEKGYKDEILEEGLPVLFTEKLGKNKKKYTKCDYYPQ